MNAEQWQVTALTLRPWATSLPVGCYHPHPPSSLSITQPGTHITIPPRVRGWVDLDTAVRVCRPLSQTHKQSTMGFDHRISCTTVRHVTTAPPWHAEVNLQNNQHLLSVNVPHHPPPGPGACWLSCWYCTDARISVTIDSALEQLAGQRNHCSHIGNHVIWHISSPTFVQ